jgi:hypothetical protein
VTHNGQQAFGGFRGISTELYLAVEDQECVK